MNFEKWMKKRGNQKLNKFAKNPYKVPWFKRIPLWTKVLVPTAALTTALFVVVVNSFPNKTSKPSNSSMNNSQLPVPQNTSSKQTSNTPTSTSQKGGDGGTGKAPWTTLPVYKRFSKFSYEGVNYIASFSGDRYEYIDRDRIGSLVSDIVITEVDDLGVERAIDAGIYRINGISINEKVALRFSVSDIYYAYVNVSYANK